ncbi:hypothetical protein NX099_07780, partial [Limosilactobacillus reuteri]|nr:hypothetical protein [Limosilactobacillus reuteri]
MRFSLRSTDEKLNTFHKTAYALILIDVYPQSWKSTLGVFYMTKISVKTKLKAVEEYANGNVTLASVR